MQRNHIWTILGAMVLSTAMAGRAHATDISGTITTTLTIISNSQLIGDVTCQVTGAPCIVIQNPYGFFGIHPTLDLNGFTITGLADPQTACGAGGANNSETGIAVSGQGGVIIRGPGIVQSFRGFGINFSNVSSSSITGVTTAGNCFSGIFMTAGSANNVLEGNISIRNGNLTNPCGGI